MHPGTRFRSDVPFLLAVLACAAGAGLLVPVTLSPAAGENDEEKVRVEVRVRQEFSFQPADFKVALATPGCTIAGEPRIRPFYGRATLTPETLTPQGFTFQWDVPGAIRAARGRLRRTKIYIHWRMHRRRARQVVETPMLTVLTLTLSPGGQVTVAEVHTSGPGPAPEEPPLTTRPAPFPRPAGYIGAAVGRLRTDPAGSVRFRLRILGEVEPAGRPRAVCTAGKVTVQPVEGSRILEVTWQAPKGGEARRKPVGITITWTVRTPAGRFRVGRTVLEMVSDGTETGLVSLRTSTGLTPAPPGIPDKAPSPASPGASAVPRTPLAPPASP